MAAFLPEEFLFDEILTKLSAKSLMRFKCVSKRWRTLISGDSSFIDTHLRHQHRYDDQPAIFITREHTYTKDEKALVLRQKAMVFSEQCSRATEVNLPYMDSKIGELRIAGSCDGLVCLTYPFSPDRVVLWNPATRQRRLLPCPPMVADRWWMGFGMDGASGDYKVVFLHKKLYMTCDEWLRSNSDPYSSSDSDSSSDSSDLDAKDQRMVHALVFAKSGNVWRDRDSGVKGFPPVSRSPVEAKGALHWKCGRIQGNENIFGVLSFDLSDETFRYANGPIDSERFNILRWRSSLAAFTHSTSVYHLYSSSSSSGGELRWTKILKYTLRPSESLGCFWRDQFVSLLWDCSRLKVRRVDPPTAPDVVKNLYQHGPFNTYHNPILWDYVETILSVF